MRNRDKVLQEYAKTRTRLEKQGIDTKGVYFGYREESEGNECNKEIWKDGADFLKVFPDELIKVAGKMVGTDAILVFALMRFISYESGQLKLSNGTPINNEIIIEMTNLSKKTVSDSMNRLVEMMVFYRGKTGKGNTYQYFANPYIFFKGKYINKTLVDMFKNYKVNIEC